MPSPTCLHCNCTESLLWQPVDENQHLCNDCFEKNSKKVKNEWDTITKATATATASRLDERKVRLRKSTRSTRFSVKNGNGLSNIIGSNGSGVTSAGSNKTSGVKSGRGRRSLFRRPPMKAPTISATTTHVKSLFYKVIHWIYMYISFIPQFPNSYSIFCLFLFYAGLIHSNRWHCFVV